MARAEVLVLLLSCAVNKFLSLTGTSPLASVFDATAEVPLHMAACAPKCAMPLFADTSDSATTVKLTVPDSSVPISDIQVRPVHERRGRPAHFGAQGEQLLGG